MRKRICNPQKGEKIMIDCGDLERVKTARSDDIPAANIDPLIADLDSRNGLVRQRARIALIRMGEPAVPGLIKALGTRNGPTHWEAAKALSLIGDPRSVQALVQALEDNEFGVRWLAAEGLISVGYCSLDKSAGVGSSARRCSSCVVRLSEPEFVRSQIKRTGQAGFGRIEEQRPSLNRSRGGAQSFECFAKIKMQLQNKRGYWPC